MRSVIQQSIVLPAPAARLFEMYLDPIAHGAFTGFPVTIGEKPGATFAAFGGQLSGTILAVVQSRLIVQSWRSVKFNASDADSKLVLSFSLVEGQSEQGRIDLVHVDVPPHDFQDVTAGWQKYYWTPWQAYLQSRQLGAD
jgi:activator of HSP90 ATPase